MKLEINGHLIHVGTGGKEFDASKPCVVFLHGSGMDHRAFALQTRRFAFGGFSVLAPDFPAHSLSAGQALESIEASADWLAQLINAAGVDRVHLVGHSQGFLTAVEFAAANADKVKSLLGMGTAAAIPVNPALIETAESNPAQAAAMMLNWGMGSKLHLGASPTPGMQPIAVGHQIMANNPLAADLKCCASYVAGDQACEEIDAPAAMILAGKDKMTPLKAGLATAEKLNAKTTVLQECGHMLPVEAPSEVLAHLESFVRSIESQSQ